MYPVRAGENIGFRDLVETYELCHGGSLAENVEWLLTDLMYNVRCLRQGDNYGYDALGTNDWVDVVKLVEVVVEPGSHGQIFCSALYFGLCLKALETEAETDRVESNVEEESSRYKESCGVGLISMWNRSFFTVPGQKGTIIKLTLLERPII